MGYTVHGVTKSWTQLSMYACRDAMRKGFSYVWAELCLVTQLCPTFCGPMDCSPPGSSVHGIFQARILEWVVISYSRGSSQPSDQTHICLAGRFLTTVPPGKSLFQKHLHTKKKIYRCSKIMNLHPPICLKKKKSGFFGPQI